MIEPLAELALFSNLVDFCFSYSDCDRTAELSELTATQWKKNIPESVDWELLQYAGAAVANHLDGWCGLEAGVTPFLVSIARLKRHSIDRKLLKSLVANANARSNQHPWGQPLCGEVRTRGTSLPKKVQTEQESKDTVSESGNLGINTSEDIRLRRQGSKKRMKKQRNGVDVEEEGEASFVPESSPDTESEDAPIPRKAHQGQHVEEESAQISNEEKLRKPKSSKSSRKRRLSRNSKKDIFGRGFASDYVRERPNDSNQHLAPKGERPVEGRIPKKRKFLEQAALEETPGKLQVKIPSKGKNGVHDAETSPVFSLRTFSDNRKKSLENQSLVSQALKRYTESKRVDMFSEPVPTTDSPSSTTTKVLESALATPLRVVASQIHVSTPEECEPAPLESLTPKTEEV